MSVASTVILPAVPTDGTTRYEPFAGAGYMAPLAEYFTRVNLTMDASGGTASVFIQFDERYTSAVSFINFHIVGSATAVEYAITMQNTGQPGEAFAITVTGRTVLIDSSRTVFNNSLLWYPPALWFEQSGELIVVVDNVDGDSLHVKAQILLFDADVRNKVPLNILMLNLPAQGATTPV